MEIFETPKDKKQFFWKPLSKYHYLDNSLMVCARQFIGVIDGEVVAHTSYVPFPMKTGWRREHRLVVHPDYQGIGIGTRFQEAVAEILYNEGCTVICTTTTPALVKAMIKNKNWILYRYGKVKNTIAKAVIGKYGESVRSRYGHMSNKASDDRITYSFSYKGRKKKKVKKNG